jgi:hypothetical protein
MIIFQRNFNVVFPPSSKMSLCMFFSTHNFPLTINPTFLNFFWRGNVPTTVTVNIRIKKEKKKWLKIICLFKFIFTINICLSGIIWNRHVHECSRIWKLSGKFMLIQCIKKCRDISGDDFLLGPNLVSFNRTVVPYEISKVNFRVETKILVSMSEKI